MIKTYDLPLNMKKALKVIHLLFIGVITGGAILMLALFFLKNTEPARIAAFDTIIMVILNTVLPYSFYFVFITSLSYSLFTSWGFAKYPWITMKWLLVIVLFLLVWFWGGTAVNSMASLSDIGPGDTNIQKAYQSSSFSAVLFLCVFTAILSFAVVLSVFKPFKKREPKFLFPRLPLIIVLSVLTIGGIIFQINSDIEYTKMRTIAVRVIDISALKDGTYEGHYKYGSFDYQVKVQVADGEIISINSVNNRNVSYMDYAKTVYSRMIELQTVDVDAVTGATTTSKALIKAVENALTK